MEEVSLTIDEANFKEKAELDIRQRMLLQKEILVSPHPQKTTPLVQSCQRDPEAPALSLINQDLLWVNKCVKKFNPYARYGVEHWKNPHAKIYEPMYGIIYKNSKKEKRVMIHSEIHKFCDATLIRVLEGLKSYNNDGIPLVNDGELSEMDPYEEVAQQGQAHPLSPAYVPDPMELDENVPVYVPEPEHLEYHAPSDDDIQVEDQPYADDASPTAESAGYIADSNSMEEDDDEDPEKDPSEKHEPEDDDDDDIDDEDEEPTKEEEEEHLALVDSSLVPVVNLVSSVGDTEAFETDESAPTPRSPQTRVPFSQTRLCRARNTVRLEPPMSTSMEARIAEHDAAPIPPTSPTYDQAPLGHRADMIRMIEDISEEDQPPWRRFLLTAPPPGCDVAESSAAAAARAPRGQYDFVDAVEAGQGLIRSPGHDARTIARVVDRAEYVGYVRALQAFERRMMTSMEEVNLRVSYQAQVRRQESEIFYTQLHDARTDRRDIRLEIDVVRGQRTAYETELHEVRQAYLRSEAQNRALLARLETLETHMTRMEWQRQRAEDDAVRQIMRTHVLEARARIDTVEDTGSSC
ncbi:hypothetical protein Tco_0268496 [Tanacetum coccineum]